MTKTEAAGTAGGVLERSEIAFFDVETTVPTKTGQRFAILEFGAILVCPKRLEEKWSYSTLVRPTDPGLISSLSVRCNGITPDAVVSAPSFSHIADTVYDILHGRIWAGHNIQRFDCARIREAFAEIGREPPEPKEIIDSLTVLTQRFGRRAGNMKMATLATYFGLGKQTHRSLDDVRMNLEVLKYCATVLFLESSLPEAFPENGWISPNAATRSRKSGKSPKGTEPNLEAPSSSSRPANIRVLPPVVHATDENHPILYLAPSCSTIEDPFDMGTLSNEISADSFQPDTTEVSSTASVPEGSGGCTGFVLPDEVSTASISVLHVPYFRGSQRVVLLHRDVPLQLCCPRLKVRFGLSTKFVDYAGRPRLSFVVNAPPSLCKVLDACDEAARKLFDESGSSSDWRRVVSRKDGFVNYPTIRLNIPTNVNGDITQYGTEIYQHESSGSMQKLVFSKSDAAELDSLIIPGAFLDIYLSLDPYDYQQNAGIKLVAKKIVLHNK